MSQELQHLVWAGARWERGKMQNTKLQTGVLLYFSFKVKAEIIWFCDHRPHTGRFVTANYKLKHK